MKIYFLKKNHLKKINIYSNLLLLNSFYKLYIKNSNFLFLHLK